jgi:uncharacterized protein YbjT (DUF2867 family)
MDVGVSGLAVAGQQTAAVARNIPRSGDWTASRRTANAITALGGGVRVVSVTCASDEPAQPRRLVPRLQQADHHHRQYVRRAHGGGGTTI